MKAPTCLHGFEFKKACLSGLLFATVVAGPWVASSRGQTLANWGNSFNTGSTAQSLVVTNVNSQWTTFTADSNFAVSSVWISGNGAMTASTSMNVEIYAVDTLTGKPTGAALATQLVTTASSGWNQVSGFNYTLTQGNAYALKLTAVTGNPSFGWRFLNSTVPAPFVNTNSVQPGSGDTDPYWARGTNNVAPVTQGQAVWILENASGHGFGQPFNASASPNLGSATAAVGQRFRFDAPDGTNHVLTNVQLTLNVAATPPANLLTVRLLSSNGTILTTGTLDLSAAAAGIGRYTVDFNSTYQLTDQDFYYLALYSTNSVADSVKWLGGLTGQTLDSTFLDATFQGQSGYAVTWNSQSNFSTVATTSLDRDYSFNLGLVPEPSTYALMVVAGGILFVVARRKKFSA